LRLSVQTISCRLHWSVWRLARSVGHSGDVGGVLGVVTRLATYMRLTWRPVGRAGISWSWVFSDAYHDPLSGSA
jgi:hypothetical protein